MKKLLSITLLLVLGIATHSSAMEQHTVSSTQSTIATPAAVDPQEDYKTVQKMIERIATDISAAKNTLKVTKETSTATQYETLIKYEEFLCHQSSDFIKLQQIFFTSYFPRIKRDEPIEAARLIQAISNTQQTIVGAQATMREHYRRMICDLINTAKDITKNSAVRVEALSQLDRIFDTQHSIDDIYRDVRRTVLVMLRTIARPEELANTLTDIDTYNRNAYDSQQGYFDEMLALLTIGSRDTRLSKAERDTTANVQEKIRAARNKSVTRHKALIEELRELATTNLEGNPVSQEAFEHFQAERDIARQQLKNISTTQSEDPIA